MVDQSFDFGYLSVWYRIVLGVAKVLLEYSYEEAVGGLDAVE